MLERVEDRRVDEPVAGPGRPQRRLDRAQQDGRRRHLLAGACVEGAEFAAAVEAGQRAVQALEERLDAQGVERRRRVHQDADVGPEGAEAVVVLGRGHGHDVRVVTGAGAWADRPPSGLEGWPVGWVSAAAGSPRLRRSVDEQHRPDEHGRDQRDGRQAEHGAQTARGAGPGRAARARGG